MDRATFLTTYANPAGTFAENTNREVGEGDLQQFAQDIADTFAIGSTANVLSTQVFSIEDMNMDTTSLKTVYCGPSSNVINCKSFSGLIIADPTAGLPYAKYDLPFMVGGSAVAQMSALFISGASATVNISRMAASIFDSSDFDLVPYNRGLITLFF